MAEELQENQFTQEDIEKNKVMAILGYIIFFLPLLACPDSKFARYHSNQGLLVLLFSIIFHVAFNIIFGIVWIPFISSFITGIVSLATLALVIIGIINASSGKAKPLPVIGGITIIK